jgi:hypothetical protein
MSEIPKNIRETKAGEMAQRLARYSSVDHGKPLYGIEGMLSRLPILSRRGEHGVKFYSSDQVDSGNIQMN